MTLRQKKLLANIGKHRSIEQDMIASGYAPSTAKQQTEIIHAPSFEELLSKHLPDVKVMIAHEEGLEAMKVISAKIVGLPAGGNTDDFIEVPDHPTRLKAAELAYKVKGRLKDGLNVQGDVTMNVIIVRHAETA